MKLEVPDDYKLRFPARVFGFVQLGTLSFYAPAGHPGGAKWRLDGVEHGMVRWPSGEPGEQVQCTFLATIAELTGVHGMVHSPAGEPVSAAISGCGAHGYANADGSFFTLVEANGPCAMRARSGANMNSALGPPVMIDPRPGVDVIGVDLVAPDPPEWRDATDREADGAMRQLCEYWAGTRAEQLAIARVQAREDPAFDSSIVVAERRYRQALARYCADVGGGRPTLEPTAGVTE